jgi:hypothetical protein
MRLRNLIAKSAIVGAFVLTVAACAPAQQGTSDSSSSPVATGQVNKGLQKDPNFPPLSGMNDGPIYWTYHTATRPEVHFKIPAADGAYLGFDDKGSLIQNQGNGKVYRWNLKENSLTVVANRFVEVPLDELAGLKNTDQTLQYYLAKNGKGPMPEQPPVPVAQNPSPKPPQANSPFGPDAGSALAALIPSGASAADITGKNASIKAGVLTFILADGTKSKPYTVVRPKIMANASQSDAGIAGTWIAMESGGKAMMFNVRADNTVTGKEISPQVVQMLMKGRDQR